MLVIVYNRIDTCNHKDNGTFLPFKDLANASVHIHHEQ